VRVTSRAHLLQSCRDDLDLGRHRVVFFALSWTVVHPIDANSPMWGLTHKELINSYAEFLVLLIATHETVSQTVHSRSSYKADEVIWGAKFANMFLRTEAEGIIGMDLSRIHEIEMVYSRIGSSPLLAQTATLKRENP
jgi:inward rectifier potassium channel